MRPLTFKLALQYLVPVALTLSPATGFALDLEEILELNANAHGGSENWAKIENVRVELTISEPGFEVNGLYVATRNGRMRIDIQAGGQPVFSEGLNGGKAWQWTPARGVEWQEEQSAAALRHGIEMPGRFCTIQDLAEAGKKVTLVDSMAADDQGFWVIRVQLEDGFSRDLFIDKKTGKTMRESDVRAFHPAVDATRINIETRYSEEEWVDGVLKFMRSENVNGETEEWLGTNIAKSLSHNATLAADYFNPGPGVE